MDVEDEILTASLVAEYTNAAKPGTFTARRLRSNFGVMAVCFSLNHGCVTALIALASTELGHSLGNGSLGTLYFVYTLTAAFFSQAVTAKLGAKRTLMLGLWIYCAYVASYLIAYECHSHDLRMYAVYTGAVLGGVAAGILWPAQGKYYATVAEKYAEASGLSREAANSRLSSDFAAYYLSCEVAMKLLSSALPQQMDSAQRATQILFALFTAIAVVSAAGVSAVDEVEQDCEREEVRLGTSAAAALKLLVSDPKCACMLPMNFAFGFGAAYLNGYFMSAVVAQGINTATTNNIGYVSSVVVGTAALCAKPLGWLGKKIGAQLPVVLAGAACFGAFALVNLNVPAESLQTWRVIVPLVAVFGVGRATWENNFKATFADYFPNDKTAAFANVQLQSGIASTVGFFLNNAKVSATTIGHVALYSAGLALVFQVLAFAIHVRERRAAHRAPVLNLHAQIDYA